MELMRFQNEKKKDDFYKSLLSSLSSLQKKINNEENNFDLDNFLNLLGKELGENSISFLLTIFSDKKDSIFVRYLNDSSENHHLRKTIDTVFKSSFLKINENNDFSRVYLKREVQYLGERQRVLMKEYPQTRKILIKESFNSIISPILIKGECIGFFEFLSKNLQKDHREIVEIFSQGFVKSISNSILFDELRVSEKKFHDIFENAEEGFYVLNGKKKKFVEVNRAFEKISGYTRDELLQMNYLLLFSPEEMERINVYVKNRIKNKDSDSSPKNYETEIKRKNGEKRNLKINISHYINDDEWFVIANDITNSKIAEAKIFEARKHLLSVIDTIHDGIFVVDKSMKILSYNKYFAQKVGFNVEEIKNQKCSKILPKYENNLFADKYKKFGNISKLIKKVFEEEKFFSVEKKQKWEGKTVYYKIDISPTMDKEGHPYQAVITISDISKNREAEEKIRKLNEGLEKKVKERTAELDLANKNLNEALDLKLKFISDASHELRTPLTIMKGNLDLLLLNNKNIEAPLLATYKDMDDEIERMSRIIADLTMLTNSDSNIEKLKIEKINFSSLLNSVLRSMGVIAKDKKISLKKNHVFGEIFIEGDEMKIEKLLINIIRNALKYTDSGGWVKVMANKKEENLIVKIKDNGIGIPEKDQKNIFERFYRVDKARSRMEGGTGLGLSISKWIVEAHGGEIKVQSKEGLGSEFILSLPIKQKNANLQG